MTCELYSFFFFGFPFKCNTMEQLIAGPVCSFNFYFVSPSSRLEEECLEGKPNDWPIYLVGYRRRSLIL